MSPGVFGLSRDNGAHAWMLVDVDAYGVPKNLQSSISWPKKKEIIELAELNAWNSGSYVYGVASGLPKTKKSGYRMIRKPKDLDKRESQIASVSYEQFKIPVADHVSYFQENLQSLLEQLGPKMERLAKNICSKISDRIKEVNFGVEHGQSIGGQCMSQGDYHNYSTPSRDKALFDAYIDMRQQFVASVKRDGNSYHTLEPAQKSLLDALFPFYLKSVAEELAIQERINTPNVNFCNYDVGNGYQVSIEGIKVKLFAGQISNDPNDTLEERWGLSVGSPSGCNNYGETWVPNLDGL